MQTKKQRRNQRIKQVGLLIFLGLIVLGFTVPGFLHGDQTTSNPTQLAEPRLCTTDAQCYLTCDDSPAKVLCSQNICVQNSCEEGNPYRFRDEPTTFTLNIVPEDAAIDLSLYYNTQNIFVKAQGQTVDLYAYGLTVRHALEKLNVRFDQSCMYLGQESFCSSEKPLTFLVNGESNTQGVLYVPQAGDVITIAFEQQ